MHILFWSGGKDSYMALELFTQNNPDAHIKLLSTYNKETGMLPSQGISINEIKKQAAQLDYELITIPLPPHPSNGIYLNAIDKALNSEKDNTETFELIFGDWANSEIREWREQVFQNDRGYICHFPIWGKSLNELMPILIFKPVRVYITQVEEKWQPYLREGEEYTQQLVRMLPEGMDPMGESGEFHTWVEIQSLKEQVI